MNRDDLIRLAREAGYPHVGLQWNDQELAFLGRFAELAAAAERQMCKEYEAMAECMLMVRLELVSAGLVDKSVPPMMLPEAILSAHRAAVAKERASRRAAQCEAVDLKERVARVGVEHRRVARKAVLDEREACAQVLDAMAAEAEADLDPSFVVAYYRDRAAAIRARGNP